MHHSSEFAGHDSSSFVKQGTDDRAVRVEIALVQILESEGMLNSPARLL
jgi:hypothetical protein